MGALVVVPCLPVGRAEIAEARRALTGQGRSGLTDDAVVRLLWAARALPAALDVIADLTGNDVEFDGIDIEPGDVTVRGPLSLIAWRRDDELIVEVIVVRDQDLLDRSFDAAVCRLMLPLRRLPPANLKTDDDITAEDNVIRLQRFSFGARGKTS